MKFKILGAALALALTADPTLARDVSTIGPSIFLCNKGGGQSVQQVLRLHGLERLATARRVGFQSR
jgi:hypothetical protein